MVLGFDIMPHSTADIFTIASVVVPTAKWLCVVAVAHISHAKHLLHK